MEAVTESRHRNAPAGYVQAGGVPASACCLIFALTKTGLFPILFANVKRTAAETADQNAFPYPAEEPLPEGAPRLPFKLNVELP